MIALLQRKKEEFYEDISKRYYDTVKILNADISNLHSDMDSVKALTEIIQCAKNSDDVIGVLEVRKSVI